MDEFTPSDSLPDTIRGISPVVGVILMVGITVVLAGVLSVFVLGIGIGGSTSQAGLTVEEAEAGGATVRLVDGGTAERVRVTYLNTTETLTVGESVHVPEGTSYTVLGETEGKQTALKSATLKLGVLSEGWTKTTVAGRFIATSGDGNLYSVSANVDRWYPSNGSTLWSNAGGDGTPADEATADATGNVYVAYTGLDKINESGGVEWSAGIGSDEVLSVATNSNGYVYAGNQDNTLYEVYAANGSTTGDQYSFSADVTQVAVDAQGNVFAGAGDGHVVKFGPDLTQQWADTHSSSVVAMTAKNGNLYVAYGDDTIRKYSGDDSSPVWEHEYTTASWDKVHALDVDANGNVYVAYERRVEKLSPDGDRLAVYDDFETNWWISDVEVAPNGDVYFVEFNNTGDDIIHKLNG